MNITREFIEQLNMDEPHCFKNGREEQWFYVGLKYGLEAADNNPKLPWISVKNDLPCNHKELIDPMLIGACEETVLVVVWNGSSEALDYMTHIDNEWKWYHNESNTYWCPLPELQNKN